MPETSNLAVFDFDGTIHRHHLILEWFRGFVHRGCLAKHVLHEATQAQEAHHRRELSFDNYSRHLVDILLHRLGGIDTAVATELGAQVVRREEKHLYVFTRMLLQAAMDAGYVTVIISGSPIQIVYPFAKTHGVSHVFATTFRERRGLFTGKVKEDWIAERGKARALKRVCMKLGLDPARDLKQSFAIGDAASDATMFELVGYPICFNPNRALRALARDRLYPKRPWSYVVERSDACDIHQWYGHSQEYQICRSLNPILPSPIVQAMQKPFAAAFG